MSSETVSTLHAALLHGLEDYSVDERGDVGSWIRLASVQGLTRFSELLMSNAASIPDFGAYFPPSKYHQTIAGILKQGVERFDNVRQEAGECFMRLLFLPLPDVHNGQAWCMPGLRLLNELFQRYVALYMSWLSVVTGSTPVSDTETVSWHNGNWLFPKVVRLLEVPEYRKPILTGLILSLGSKTDSTVSLNNSLSNIVSPIPCSNVLRQLVLWHMSARFRFLRLRLSTMSMPLL